MNGEEFDEWQRLTDRLRRQGFKGDAEASESGSMSMDLKKLLLPDGA